jgi:hypothetical protein
MHDRGLKQHGKRSWLSWELNRHDLFVLPYQATVQHAHAVDRFAREIVGFLNVVGSALAAAGDILCRLAGLYAGSRRRTTTRPTAERLLEVFGNLTLTIVQLPGQLIWHLTPLSALQQQLLSLLDLDEDVYRRLGIHSAQPPG